MTAASPARRSDSPGAGAGAVYDRGYRPFDGRLGGRRAARAALFRASVRRATGMRRSWRQKFFPWLLLAVASVPAVVWVGVAYITRNTPAEAIEIISFREYLGVSTALLAFVALAAPDVLCPDRRNRTLPLLFARPLTGADYVAAKVGAIAAVVFLFTFLPQVVLYVGQLLVSDSALEYFRDHLDVLWKVPLATSLFSLYFAALSCAVASLTTRRLVAAASLLVLVLGSSALAAGLSESTGAPRQRSGIEVEIDPEELEGIPGPGGRPGFEPGPIDGPRRDGPRVIIAHDEPSSPWGAVNLLAVPRHVRDLVFEGETVEPYLDDVDGGGALAIAVYVLVLGASTGVLLWRYRWLEP